MDGWAQFGRTIHMAKKGQDCPNKVQRNGYGPFQSHVPSASMVGTVALFQKNEADFIHVKKTYNTVQKPMDTVSLKKGTCVVFHLVQYYDHHISSPFVNTQDLAAL